MDTVVITNQKGGVGKSTITALLAWWLTEKEQARIALLDLDSQKNLTRTFAQHRYDVSATRLFGAGSCRTEASLGFLGQLWKFEDFEERKK